MKELDRSEARKGSSIGTELRTELTDVEPDPSISMRSWGGEVKGEDRWRIELPTTKPGAPSPYDQFDMLEKSRPTLHGLHHLHRASRRVFSCFRHSSINLTVPYSEPNTPPKGGPLIALRPSVSGANGLTFMNEAIDFHHLINDDDTDSEEPTSPVMNCMGQVKPKKTLKHCRMAQTPKDRDKNEIFRRAKSLSLDSGSIVAKFNSCKWKQLLRSSSSSISQSGHPLCDGGIDLGRFRSESRTSEPLNHSAEKRPDKTCLLMRQNSCRTIPTNCHESGNTLKLLQEQLDAGNSGNVVRGGGFQGTIGECEPVFRKLPSLKTARIKPPKYCADEARFNRRHGVLCPGLEIGSLADQEYFLYSIEPHLIRPHEVPNELFVAVKIPMCSHCKISRNAHTIAKHHARGKYE